MDHQGTSYTTCDEKVAIGDGVLLLEVRTSRRAVDTASRQIIIKSFGVRSFFPYSC